MDAGHLAHKFWASGKRLEFSVTRICSGSSSRERSHLEPMEDSETELAICPFPIKKDLRELGRIDEDDKNKVPVAVRGCAPHQW